MIGKPYYRKTALLALTMLVATGCATMRAPTGGPVDNEPPQPVPDGVHPPNGSVRVKTRTFRFTFNEYVKLKNPTQQVLISPPLDRTPDFEVKKYTVTVTLNDTLEPNTTYNINFGNAIQDITEGNSANLSYVFSTGDHLDSLTIEGSIIDALTLQGKDDVRVMLYREMEDSLPYQEKPFYFTTSKNGVFKFQHLKQGEYKLFSIQDENSNYLFDEGEEIGFLSEKVTVSPETQSTETIKMFKEIPERNYLEKKLLREPGMVLLTFKHPPGKLELVPLKPKKFIGNIESSGDSVLVWLDPSFKDDSIHFEIYSDRIEPQILKFGVDLDEEEMQGHKLKPSIMGKRIPPGDSVVLKMPEPIASIDEAKMFTVDADSARQLVSATFAPWSRVVRLSPIPTDDAITLVLDKGAITSKYGRTNDSTGFTVEVLQDDDYARLTLSIIGLDSVDEKSILQILNEKNNVVREVIHPQPHQSFNYLLPGKYKARLILDTDENNSWTTGNYLAGKQPEEVLYFNESISLRGGWDVDTEWDLTKDQP